jgi:hypothetical protein
MVAICEKKRRAAGGDVGGIIVGELSGSEVEVPIILEGGNV